MLLCLKSFASKAFNQIWLLKMGSCSAENGRNVRNVSVENRSRILSVFF